MAKRKTNFVEKENIDEHYIKKAAKKVTAKDVETVVSKSREIEHKIESNTPFKRFSEDLRLMLSLIKDYWKGDYRKILWFTISAIVFVLLYIWNPLDLLPDLIPFVGYVDDALVFSIAFKLVEKDLQRYNKWKLKKQSSPGVP